MRKLTPFLSLSLVLVASLGGCGDVGEHCAGAPCEPDLGPSAGPDAGAESVFVTVTSAGSGQGSILVDGEACAETPCELQLAKGSAVTLQAAPDLQSGFAGWSNACERSQVCELVVTENLQVDATFEVAGELLAQRGLPGIAGAKKQAMDAEGNVYALGVYHRAQPFESTEDGISRSHGYLVKYSPEGAALWVHRFDFDSLSFKMYELALGPNGEVYATGNGHKYDANIGENRFQSFIARIDPQSGSQIWRHTDHTIGSWGLYLEMKVDPLGRIFVSGVLGRGKSLSLGGILLQTASDQQSGFLATLTDTGGVISARKLDALYPGGMIANPEGGVTISNRTLDGQFVLEDVGHDGALRSNILVAGDGQVARLADGSFVIVGSHNRAVSWGEAPELQLPAPEGSRPNLFLAKVAPDGTTLWVRSMGGTTEEHVRNLVVGQNDNIFFSGVVQYPGTIDLGGGQLPRFGYKDGFMASYSSDGGYRWSRTVGSPDNQVDISHLDVQSSVLRVFGDHKEPLVTELGTLETSTHPDAAALPTSFKFTMSQ